MAGILVDDSLAQSLFEVMNSFSGMNYILVDRALFPEFDTFWEAFSSRSDINATPLYRGTVYDYLVDFSPILIEVEEGGPGETIFYWLQEQGEYYQRFGFFGVSYTDSLEAIQAHWAKWVTCIYPNSDKALLRFYDPSVLIRLWGVFGEQQQAVFIGDNNRVFLPHGQLLQELTLTGALVADTVCIDEQEMSYPLQLSQSQYDVLFYDQRVKALASALHAEIAPNYAWLLPYRNVEALIWQGLALAEQKYPNDSTFAWETYAVYRFHLSSHFDEHPDFKALLKLHALRDAIGIFYQRKKRNPDLVKAYHQSGWLGIDGKASLIIE